MFGGCRSCSTTVGHDARRIVIQWLGHVAEIIRHFVQSRTAVDSWRAVIGANNYARCLGEAASRPHPNSDKTEDKNRYASSVRAGACARHRRRDRSALDRLAASAPCPCRRRKSAPSGLRAGNSRMTDRTPGQTLQIDAIHRTRRRESTIRREARAAHSEIPGRQLDWLALAGERKGGHNIARVEGKPTSVDRHVPDDHAGSALALVHSFLSARAIGRPPIDATSAPPMPGEIRQFASVGGPAWRKCQPGRRRDACAHTARTLSHCGADSPHKRPVPTSRAAAQHNLLSDPGLAGWPPLRQPNARRSSRDEHYPLIRHVRSPTMRER